MPNNEQPTTIRFRIGSDELDFRDTDQLICDAGSPVTPTQECHSPLGCPLADTSQKTTARPCIAQSNPTNNYNSIQASNTVVSETIREKNTTHLKVPPLFRVVVDDCHRVAEQEACEASAANSTPYPALHPGHFRINGLNLPALNKAYGNVFAQENAATGLVDRTEVAEPEESMLKFSKKCVQTSEDGLDSCEESLYDLDDPEEKRRHR